MTLTDRDKKIVMLLAPLALVGAFWFLLLAPKREEATRLGAELDSVQVERDQAVAFADEAQRTKSDYAQDYATVVRLGKAIPSDVDMPSLLVQLDEAAKETGINFSNITAGPRTAAEIAPAPVPSDGTAPPASDAGGAPASTGPGTAVEGANETAADADADAAAPSAEGQPATPVPGAAPAPGASGLESVPLTFSFKGSFFDLADFFHEMKRFVRLAGDGVKVGGRLMTIDGFTFSSEEFPMINAEVQASAYLSPKAEGTSAGATSAGPAGTPAATAPVTPVPSDSVPPAAPPATDGTVAQ